MPPQAILFPWTFYIFLSGGSEFSLDRPRVNRVEPSQKDEQHIETFGFHYDGDCNVWVPPFDVALWEKIEDLAKQYDSLNRWIKKIIQSKGQDGDDIVMIACSLATVHGNFDVWTYPSRMKREPDLVFRLDLKHHREMK